MIFVKDEATAARRRFPIYLVDATDGITPETGEEGGQPQVSKNGGAWGNTSATLTAIGNGAYYVELTAGELDTAGNIQVRYKSAATAEFNAPADVTVLNVHDAVRAGLTALPNAAADAAGGLPISADGTLAMDNIGKMSFSGDGPYTLEVDLVDIMGSLLTESGAGQLAAAFIKFFDKASPTGTINSLPDAVPGAANALLRAGTNAATSITTALTANIIGNITGNISGSVGSIAASGIAAASFAANAIAAAAIAAGALNGKGDWSTHDAAAVKTAIEAAGSKLTLALEDTAELQGNQGNWLTATGFATAAKLLAYLQLLARKDTAIASDNAAELAELNADGGSGAGAFSNQTDAEEAIRDAVSAISLTAAAVADAVWDELLAGHVVAGSAAVALSAAGGAADPLLNAVPGDYAEGTAGYLLGNMTAARLAKLDRIAAGLVLNSIAALGADNRMTLIAGDSYDGDDTRALTWTFSDYSGPDMAAATGVLRIASFAALKAGTTDADLEVAATVSQDGTTVTVTAELTPAQTAELVATAPGQAATHYYQLIARRDAARPYTLAYGPLAVRAGIEGEL